MKNMGCYIDKSACVDVGWTQATMVHVFLVILR